MALLDSIRAAIKASGKTRYRIAKDLDMSEGQLSELMAGRKGMGVANLERLADYLGIEFVARPKQTRKDG